MSEKNKSKETNVCTDITKEQEKQQDIDITMSEINAHDHAGKNEKGGASDEEIKANVESINPDAGTLDRG